MTERLKTRTIEKRDISYWVQEAQRAATMQVKRARLEETPPLATD